MHSILGRREYIIKSLYNIEPISRNRRPQAQVVSCRWLSQSRSIPALRDSTFVTATVRARTAATGQQLGQQGQARSKPPHSKRAPTAQILLCFCVQRTDTAFTLLSVVN